MSEIQFGWHILRTRVTEKTKKILAQLGNAMNGEVLSDNADVVTPYGFLSRPPKIETTGERRAPIALVMRTGSRDIVLGCLEFRGLSLAGDIKEGEVAVFASGEDGTAQARMLLKGTGDAALFTKKGNTEAGAGMGVFVSPDGSVTMLHPDGATVRIAADKTIELFHENGAVTISPSGRIEIVGKEKVDISAPAVTIGGLAAQPLANGPQTVAAIGVLQTEISLVAAGLAALTADPTHLVPSTVTATGAATAAVATASTALGAITPLIPTKRLAAD